MTNQQFRADYLASLETRESHDQAAREGAQMNDHIEQLYHAIDAAIKSAAMYRAMDSLATANEYSERARALVAEWRQATKGN